MSPRSADLSCDRPRGARPDALSLSASQPRSHCSLPGGCAGGCGDQEVGAHGLLPRGVVTHHRCGGRWRRGLVPRLRVRSRTVDPLLTMEASPCCYVISERRLVARFPCNLAGFSARSTLALKDPEPPRRAPNLSPEPSPKESRDRRKVGRARQMASSTRSDRSTARATSTRDETSSLRKMFRICVSTVFGLRNSVSAISGFVSPVDHEARDLHALSLSASRTPLPLLSPRRLRRWMR